MSSKASTLANVAGFFFKIASFKWPTVLLSSMSTRNGQSDTSRIQQKSVMLRIGLFDDIGEFPGTETSIGKGAVLVLVPLAVVPEKIVFKLATSFVSSSWNMKYRCFVTHHHGKRKTQGQDTKH